MTSRLPPRPTDGAAVELGTATAAYQIEGAVGEDGRGRSIWDTFTTRPGSIRDGSDGSVACDSYHRYAEDVALVAGLGVRWYRVSVAWPRVLPQGTGRVEQRGLDYYDRLVDTLLGSGVEPMVTLYHWDLPQPLEDRGGWLVRDTAEAFADFAAIVHERLGDRVGMWATLNEPWCTAYLGYAAGVHAPGRREGAQAHRAAHHLLVGHALAAHRLRDTGATDVGIVLNLAPVWPERPEAADLADSVDAVRNRVWLGPLVEGRYDERLIALAPVLGDPTVVRDGDLELVRGSADWLGLNYYTPIRPDLPDAAGDPAERHPETDAYPGVPPVHFVVREPRTAIGWEVQPAGLEQLLVDTSRRTGLPLVVAENGAAYADLVAVDSPDGTVGSIDDQDRIAYLRDHLAATERALAAGADVRAYVVWTLLDNFEWAEGYTKTFGLVHVSPADQTRTPKASYFWLADRAGSRSATAPAAHDLTP